MYVEGDPLSYGDPYGLTSQMCLYPGFNNDWPHAFTCVNGKCAGWYPSSSRNGRPVGEWKAMINSDGGYGNDNSEVSNSYCRDILSCDDEFTDKCILECRKNPPSRYNVFYSNCFTVAADCVSRCVVSSCKQKLLN